MWLGMHWCAAHGDLQQLQREIAQRRRVRGTGRGIRIVPIGGGVAGEEARGLEAGLNAYNGHGMTALHGAAFHGQVGAVGELVLAGADVNHPSRGPRHTFALHLGVARGHRGVVRVLLEEHGADPRLRDYRGLTALDVAALVEGARGWDPEAQGLRAFVQGCIDAQGQLRGKPAFAFDAQVVRGRADGRTGSQEQLPLASGSGLGLGLSRGRSSITGAPGLIRSASDITMKSQSAGAGINSAPRPQ